MPATVGAPAGHGPHPTGGGVEQANPAVRLAERERGAVGANGGGESADRIAAHDAQRVRVDRVGRRPLHLVFGDE